MRISVMVFAGVVLLLAGCGTYRKTVADITGYDKVCVGNVEYLQFPHGVTVQRNTGGRVVTCSKATKSSATRN